jgi:hypothetical protein
MWAALWTGLGMLLSAPVTMAIVAWVHPQPPWRDAEQLVHELHRVQTLPFLAGFVLIAGLVLLVGALHAAADERARAGTSAALVFAGGFCALATLNYSAQTLLVPWLATHYQPAYAPLIAAWSMVNPDSLAWGLEMWAYAWIGVATWLVAPVFANEGVERAARVLFTGNGVMSIGSAVATELHPGWAQSAVGLALFALWNAWMLAMSGVAFVALRRRVAAAAQPSSH